MSEEEENKFRQHLKDLKTASTEVWAAQIALLDIGKKYAPLCVQILVDGRHIPQLINNRIEKRRQEIGLDPVHPDFWDADMIIALYEYFENINAKEDANACSTGT
jgi:hypothetical protein